jgi:hypothetical protein
MRACKTTWIMSASAAAAWLVLGAGAANAGGHGGSSGGGSSSSSCGCASSGGGGGGGWSGGNGNGNGWGGGNGWGSSSSSSSSSAASVTVQVQNVANAITSAQSVSGAQAAARAETAGVGGAWVEQGSAPSLVQGLDVETDEAQVSRVAYQATRKVERRVLIQAVCLDDKATPHPASQAHSEREVADGYDGEIFRCIAGTRLQATIGDYNDALTLAKGETLSCDKMQALYHAPDGTVACRAQIPARDCNERSLLRRYGPGVKVLKLVREETYTAWRDETTAAPMRAVGMITLDGGVGGFH